MLTFVAANIGPPQSQLERSMRASHEVREEISAQMSIGLNWLIRNVGDEKILWHDGGTAGFTTFIGFDPDRQIGVVVLANMGQAAVGDIGLHLLNPEVPLAPAPVPIGERIAVEVAEDILETYVGEYELLATISIFVTLESGALFSRVTGQGAAPIFPESETEFFYRAVDAQISFTKNDSGVVTGMIFHQNGANQPARKISGEVPDPPDVTGGRIAVEVAEDILETYVGEYELTPGFSIVVTVEDGALFAQATGQGQLVLFAESETEFFLTALDAQVSFTKDDSGVVTGLIMHQSGVDQPGRKVR